MCLTYKYRAHTDPNGAAEELVGYLYDQIEDTGGVKAKGKFRPQITRSAASRNVGATTFTDIKRSCDRDSSPKFENCRRQLGVEIGATWKEDPRTHGQLGLHKLSCNTRLVIKHVPNSMHQSTDLGLRYSQR